MRHTLLCVICYLLSKLPCSQVVAKEDSQSDREKSAFACTLIYFGTANSTLAVLSQALAASLAGQKVDWHSQNYWKTTFRIPDIALYLTTYRVRFFLLFFLVLSSSA